MEKIKTFTDLVAWKEAHKLVIMIYEITKKFPKEEMFGLTNQLRRAAVSISSNIAEGFSRKSRDDKSRFYYMAQGSTTEVQNQLLIARDVKYFANEEFNKIANQTVLVHKLINGLIKSSMTKNT
ncbi:MAG: four helix bundle protein [bacterium]